MLGRETVITVTFTTVIALTGLEHLLCAGWFTYIISLILSVTLKVGNRPYILLYHFADEKTEAHRS